MPQVIYLSVDQVAERLAVSAGPGWRLHKRRCCWRAGGIEERRERGQVLISGFRRPLCAPQMPVWRNQRLSGRLGSAVQNMSPEGLPSGANRGRADTEGDAKPACRIFRAAYEVNSVELLDNVAHMSLLTPGSATSHEKLTQVANFDHPTCSSGSGGQIHVQNASRRSTPRGWANSTFMLFSRSPMSLPTPYHPMQLTDEATARLPASRGGAAR